MKCVLCPNEIDEMLSIHPDNRQQQREHSAALEQWEQITVYRGNNQIFRGHVCPDDRVNSIKLSKVEGKAVK